LSRNAESNRCIIVTVPEKVPPKSANHFFATHARVHDDFLERIAT
jgi:hypothetical protein